ncbi:MAG: hypothetical protein KTR18_06305 [Acidiferrobacterales bacterium]|nr:hypothetical protein [Acidiferrobacterales bacterium]
MPDHFPFNTSTDSQTVYQSYLQNGWVLFDTDSEIIEWIHHALPAARRCIEDPGNKGWFRHGNTWFAGVNVLENDHLGAVSNGSPITGEAIQFIRRWISSDVIDFDKAQVSVYYPGYPQKSDDESEAAFGYRERRDAAHVDGLLPVGNLRRRFLREHHEYILGVPMTSASAGASPFVAWRGSHHIVKQALSSILEQHPEGTWGDVDLTDIYQATRRDIFERCERVELPLKPGQTLVAHRLVLHGSAPWHANASADNDGRMICFFRPPNMTASEWLRAP